MGLEPMTSSLPRRCSTTELQQQTGGAEETSSNHPVVPGAGDGDRTHTTSLEGWGSTIELHPRTVMKKSK